MNEKVSLNVFLISKSSPFI